MAAALSNLARVLMDAQDQILADWMEELERTRTPWSRRPTDEASTEAREMLTLLAAAVNGQESARLEGENFAPVRQFLEDLSSSRARMGFSSAQTASIVFTLKRALFNALRRGMGANPEALVDAAWVTTEIVDSMGLYTVAVYQKSREAVIVRQQEDMLELSTPVVKLWDGILALPMIGTLDSARTQVVMESLLQRIVETGAEIAILDITGVPTVDTLVAQYLLKTVTAIRLMGADCIISGVRPQIAQTIVHLGVDLQGITTKATLADALALALRRTGQSVVKLPPSAHP